MSSLQMPLGRTLRIDFQNRIPFKNELPRLNPPSLSPPTPQTAWRSGLIPSFQNLSAFSHHQLRKSLTGVRSSRSGFWLLIAFTYFIVIAKNYSNILLFWHRLDRIYDLRSLASTETLREFISRVFTKLIRKSAVKDTQYF